MSEWVAVFRRGLSLDNPLVVLMIGLCPTLAVSTKLDGTFFLALSVMFVLTTSSVLISLMRSAIPELVRIPVFIVVIASFVTIVDLTLQAYLPDIYRFLGVWIPLIVVNCLILGRAEAFAYHNPPKLALADGLGMGLGFAAAILLLAGIRELVGSGQIVFMEATLIELPEWYRAPGVVMLFPGAFIVFGFIIAGISAINRKLNSRTTHPVPSCTMSEGGGAR
ncbi:MAG: electron transport complex subunit RsxE [Actinobacteria bacterium]|nr:electron transport complex subunit RsxE [Actinomycetota bacterium]MCL5888273.1 electron transport complex subunit RsxE [Actinomycetota bacterium]